SGTAVNSARSLRASTLMTLHTRGPSVSVIATYTPQHRQMICSEVLRPKLYRCNCSGSAAVRVTCARGSENVRALCLRQKEHWQAPRICSLGGRSVVSSTRIAPQWHWPEWCMEDSPTHL